MNYKEYEMKENEKLEDYIVRLGISIVDDENIINIEELEGDIYE